VQFVDEQRGFITGEFGIVVTTIEPPDRGRVAAGIAGT
jgi:hypothetical protein